MALICRRVFTKSRLYLQTGLSGAVAKSERDCPRSPLVSRSR
jgi:hypothetical protein